MGISSILSDIKNDRNSNNKNLKDNSPPLPKIDSIEFQKVLDTRRSVRVYTDEEIPEKIVNKCLENALKAPTSSNLQTWEIYWVRSKDNKDKLIKACFSQPAAKTAKELFVFVARPDHWRRYYDLMLDYINFLGRGRFRTLFNQNILDDATGLSSKSVTDWKSLSKNSELKPRITLRDGKGEIIKKADGNEALVSKDYCPCLSKFYAINEGLWL